MSAPHRYEIGLSVTLVSPYLTQGLQAGRPSIDSTLARNQDGKLVLPGSLVRGNVRAALENFWLASGDCELGQEIAIMFGDESATVDGADRVARQSSNMPDRAAVVFDDLVIAADQAEALGVGRYPRIAIDADLGSVRQGFLQMIELPFPIGERLRFEGKVHLYRPRIEAERVAALIEAALGVVPAMGSVKSSGFGRVDGERTEVTAPVPIARQAVAASSATSFLVSLEIDRPFVVSGGLLSNNLHAGSSVVPGSAIKACVAQAIAMEGGSSALAEGLDNPLSQCLFGHAFPVGSDGKVQWPLPFSLVCHDAPKACLVADMLFCEEHVPSGAQGRPLSLVYQSDWKSRHKDALSAEGFMSDGPQNEVRTRTAIAPGVGSALFGFDERGDEGAGQLFSHAAVKSRGFIWQARIEFPKRLDERKRHTILEFFKAGIAGLGKTKAVFKAIDIKPFEKRAVQPASCFALTLIAPAAINNLAKLRQGDWSIADDYRAYFERFGFGVRNFLAKQRVEGGHVALRYPPPGAGSNVDSYVLSEAGSVFLLEPLDGDQAKAAAVIADWLQWGLPPHDCYGAVDWMDFPYLPENGYGAVELDRVDHRALTPNFSGKAA